MSVMWHSPELLTMWWLATGSKCLQKCKELIRDPLITDIATIKICNLYEIPTGKNACLQPYVGPSEAYNKNLSTSNGHTEPEACAKKVDAAVCNTGDCTQNFAACIMHL